MSVQFLVSFVRLELSFIMCMTLSMYILSCIIRTISVCVHFINTIILLKSVGVSKRQVAILARSSREMSLTVGID